MSKFIKLLLAILPILAVLLGLYVFSNAFVAVMFYLILMLVVILINKNTINFKMIFSGWKWKEGITLTIVSGLSGIFLLFIWSYIQKTGINSSLILENFNINSWTIIFFGIYLIFVNPFVEEVFWRHILNTDSKFDYVFDVFFATYHLFVLAFFINIIGLILAFITLFSISVIWRELKSKYNGLLIPFISHTLADISIMLFAYLLIPQ